MGEKTEDISKSETGKSRVISVSRCRCALVIYVPQGKRESEVLSIYCIWFHFWE